MHAHTHMNALIHTYIRSYKRINAHTFTRARTNKYNHAHNSSNVICMGPTIDKFNNYNTIDKFNNYNTIDKFNNYNTINRFNNYNTIDRFNNYKKANRTYRLQYYNLPLHI